MSNFSKFVRSRVNIQIYLIIRFVCDERSLWKKYQRQARFIDRFGWDPRRL